MGAWLSGAVLGTAVFSVLSITSSSASTFFVALNAAGLCLVFVAYGSAYIIARMALAKDIAAASINRLRPNPLPDNLNELQSRAFSIGLTAALNGFLILIAGSLVAKLAFPIPHLLALFVFAVNSFAAMPRFSRDRRYQRLLGWSGWIMPMSLLASAFGFAWFSINFPFALASGIKGGGSPFRIDPHTGAVETVGGITGLVAFRNAAAGAVGHFVFVVAPFGSPPARFQEPFNPTKEPHERTTAAHETGHVLDYVAFGGLRVLFALIDQVILGNWTTAYTELTADSHARNPGRLQVRIWS